MSRAGARTYLPAARHGKMQGFESPWACVQDTAARGERGQLIPTAAFLCSALEDLLKSDREKTLMETLGETMGKPVGEPLGETLGEALGETLWETLGETLWETLANHRGNPMGKPNGKP